MKRRDLIDYEYGELDLIRRSAGPVIERGHIATARDLYPDLSPWPANIAFARGEVPLPVLLLLHEKVAVYVPPTSRSRLEARWMTSTDTVFELCRRGLIQPLIGHPTDYTASFVQPLLAMHPPSVWSRGLGLLRALGMEETLQEARARLPISEIAALPWVRRRWRNHFPGVPDAALTANIERELATHYADLWVFGFGELGRGLEQVRDPTKVAQALFFANEIKTYPTLFGLGGVAHYDITRLEAEPTLLGSEAAAMRSGALLIPPELEILLEGVGIRAREMSPTDIVQFHASDSARHLRAALIAFNNEAGLSTTAADRELPGQVLAAAWRLQLTLKNALAEITTPQAVRIMERTERRLEWQFRAGGLAVGAGLANLLGTGWIGFGALSFGMAAVEKIVPAGWKTTVVRAAIAEQLSPGIAHLWRASGGGVSRK